MQNIVKANRNIVHVNDVIRVGMRLAIPTS